MQKNDKYSDSLNVKLHKFTRKDTFNSEIWEHCNIATKKSINGTRNLRSQAIRPVLNRLEWTIKINGKTQKKVHSKHPSWFSYVHTHFGCVQVWF